MSLANDQAIEELKGRIEAIENAFVAAAERRNVRGELDAFGILRLKRYLTRCTEVDDVSWWSRLSEAWASYLRDDDGDASERAEVDRVMLDLEPHDLNLARSAQCYLVEERERRIASIGTTRGAPIGLSVEQACERLGWSAATAFSSAGRLTGLRIVEDVALNTLDGYGGPRLGPLTALGVLLVERIGVEMDAPAAAGEE